MKISIITVTFNSEASIAQTIESVLEQSYTDIEYIVVDGNSSDCTLEIVKQYKPKFNGRMKWISEPDSGMYEAINKGIRMAAGDVVGILNSDDFYYRTDVIGLVADAFTNSDTEVVFGDVRFVNPGNLNKTVRYYSSRNFQPNHFRFGFMPAHPTFFTLRSHFDTYGYYHTDYQIAADYELLIRFLYTNRLRYKYLPIDMVKMRTGGLSTESWRSNLILNREIVRGCKANGIYTNMFILSFKYLIKIFELWITR